MTTLDETKKETTKEEKVTLALAIISLPFCLLAYFSVIGVALATYAFIRNAKNKKAPGEEIGLYRTIFILCVISLVLNCFAFVVSVVVIGILGIFPKK
jgi:uncharacterized membrane protein